MTAPPKANTPLTPPYAERIERIAKRVTLPTLIHSLDTIFYLTGFEGTAGIALFYEGAVYLFVDSRYYEHAERHISAAKAVLSAGNDSIIDFLLARNETTLAIEKTGVSLSAYEALTKKLAKANITACAIDDLAMNERMAKDKYEITLMKDNLFRAECAYVKTLSRVKEGMTERELAAELDYLCRREGGEKPSFDTIVLFGARSSMPHGHPSDARLTRGDCVLIDFGLKRLGYCTDMTRTFFFGRPKEYTKFKKCYDATRSAQARAIETAVAGRTMNDVDHAARKAYKEAKLERYFAHSIGHGIGIEIHEPPFVHRETPVVLKRGAIITVEPGVYIPGLGGVRIENEVIVTKDKGVSINTAPTDLVVL